MCLLLLQIPPNHADVSTQLPPALKKCLLQQHPTQLRRLGDSRHTNCAQKKAAVQAAQSAQGHPSIGRGGIIVCYQQRPLAALAVTERRLIIIRWQLQSPNASARSSLSLYGL